MLNHILNVVKDIFDPRDHVVAPNKAATPVVVDFRSKVPYIKDQAQEGSCTAHAGSEILEMLVRQHQSNFPASIDRNTLRFSSQFLYGQERTMEGDFYRDNGAQSRTIFRVLNQIGCCEARLDPYLTTNEFTSPTPEMLVNAKQFTIGAYHRILDVDTAKTVLQSGYTFTLGTPLFNQFEGDQAAETGLIAMPMGSSIGGHELHVVGCNDTMNVLGQIGAFIVQNSWGEGWGDKGYCFIPYAYITQMLSELDMWTCHFGKPWIPTSGIIPANIT